MAEEITTSAANQGGAIGHIVRIVGPVVDVEFAPGQIPAIYNALTVEATTPIGDVKVLLEVQLHLPGDLVRAVAMSSTDGLQRGLEVKDTGNPMMMPVGPETLGRIWNVMGDFIQFIVLHLLTKRLLLRPKFTKPVLRLSTLSSHLLRVVRPVCLAALE